MVTLNAHFDGKVIVPDELVGLAAGARLRVTVESVDQPVPAASGHLDLPFLTGVDPEVVRAIVEDREYDIENANSDRTCRR
jgi:hypothetical protein